MTDAYTKYAAICSKFYELTVDSAEVAKFVFDAVEATRGERALFVGGMFGVAAALLDMGLALTVVDYSHEMVAVGQSLLPRVMHGDLASLDAGTDFDLVLVVGRVFTHMTSEAQLDSALRGCFAALRAGGRLFADNYETSKIETTGYFNGTVVGRESWTVVTRVSTTERISEQPRVVSWRAQYSGVFRGERFEFSDVIPHRAFSRAEFATRLAHAGFELQKQADNFDETSFYTVGRRSSK